MTSFVSVSYMLVFPQSKHIGAIKRIFFYYRHVHIPVFFRVFVCSLPLLCILSLAHWFLNFTNTLYLYVGFQAFVEPHVCPIQQKVKMGY